jgi:alkanesulfonate monooxygenase SsuD/methylene tetrahydromethanopterin reductase-like flavin-dependent oxidoreductase (luciferase family)
LTTIGLSITGPVPPATLPDVLERSVRLGFDEIWVSETFFGGGPLTTATLALERTALPVGFSVLSTAARHPAALAMEIATLACLYPGRVRLGLGLGAGPSLHRMGLDEAEGKADLPRVVETLRRLLRGEAVRCARDGHGAVDAVRLDHVPDVPPPILLAGMGPQGLRHAARDGDGVLLSWVSCPAYIGWARELTGHGAGGTKYLGTNAMLIADADRDRARAAARAVLAGSLPHKPRAMLEPLGLLPVIAPYRGGAAMPAERVREEWIDELAVAGDDRDCRRALQRLAAAGTDAVILCPVGGKDLLAMLDCLSAETLRTVRG